MGDWDWDGSLAQLLPPRPTAPTQYPAQFQYHVPEEAPCSAHGDIIGRQRRRVDVQEWGGGLDSVLSRPARAERHQDDSGAGGGSVSPRTAAALGFRPVRAARVADDWGGDLSAVLATSAFSKPRISRPRAAREQSSQGVLAALSSNAEPAAPMPFGEGAAIAIRREDEGPG